MTRKRLSFASRTATGRRLVNSANCTARTSPSRSESCRRCRAGRRGDSATSRQADALRCLIDAYAALPDLGWRPGGSRQCVERDRGRSACYPPRSTPRLLRRKLGCPAVAEKGGDGGATAMVDRGVARHAPRSSAGSSRLRDRDSLGVGGPDTSLASAISPGAGAPPLIADRPAGPWRPAYLVTLDELSITPRGKSGDRNRRLRVRDGYEGKLSQARSPFHGHDLLHR